MALIWTTCAENFTGAASLGGPICTYLPVIWLRISGSWPGLRRWWNAGGAQMTISTALGVAALACFVWAAPGVLPTRMMMAAILLAAVLATLAGFAFSAICGAMLFHLSADSAHLVQIMMVCSIANQAAMTWAIRQDIDWRRLAYVLAGGLPGLPIGVWLLLHVPRAIYSHALGAVLVTYSVYMLFRKPITILGHRPVTDLAVTLISGVAGGLAGFPGGLLAIWLGMKGWDKTRQRGVCQPFILLMQLVALVLISCCRAGSGAVRLNPSDLLFVPASLLGASIGFSVYRRLSDLQFARCANLSLLASGLSFVI